MNDKEKFEKEAIAWNDKNKLRNNVELAKLLYWCDINIKVQCKALRNFGKSLEDGNKTVLEEVDRSLDTLHLAEDLFKTIDGWLKEDEDE